MCIEIKVSVSSIINQLFLLMNSLILKLDSLKMNQFRTFIKCHFIPRKFAKTNDDVKKTLANALLKLKADFVCI